MNASRQKVVLLHQSKHTLQRNTCPASGPRRRRIPASNASRPCLSQKSNLYSEMRRDACHRQLDEYPQLRPSTGTRTKRIRATARPNTKHKTCKMKSQGHALVRRNKRKQRTRLTRFTHPPGTRRQRSGCGDRACISGSVAKVCARVPHNRRRDSPTGLSTQHSLAASPSAKSSAP